MDNKEIKLLREFKYLLNPGLLVEDVTTQAICIIQFIPNYGARFQYEHDLDSPEYWEMASPFKYARQLDGLGNKINALSKKLNAIEDRLYLINANYDEREAAIPADQKETDQKLQYLWKEIVKFSAEKKSLTEKLKQLSIEHKNLLDEQPLDSARESVIPGETGRIGGTIVISFLEHALMKSAVHHGVADEDEEKEFGSGWTWLKRVDNAKIDINKEIESGSVSELPEEFRNPALFKSPPKLGRGPDSAKSQKELASILKDAIPDYSKYLTSTQQQKDLLLQSINRAVEDGISISDFIAYWKWKRDSNAMNKWAEENFGKPVAEELGYEPVMTSPYKVIYTLLANNFHPSGRDVVREIGTKDKTRGKRSKLSKEKVKGERERQQSESVKGYDIKLTIYLDIDYLFDENGNKIAAEVAPADQISAFHKALMRIMADGPTWLDISGGPSDAKYGHWTIFGKIENLESSIAHSVLNWWKQHKFGDVGQISKEIKQSSFNEIESLYDSQQKDAAYEAAKNLWDSYIAEISNILTKMDNDGLIKISHKRILELSLLGEIIKSHIIKMKPGLKNYLNLDKLDSMVARGLFQENGIMSQVVKSVSADPKNISGLTQYIINLHKK